MIRGRALALALVSAALAPALVARAAQRSAPPVAELHVAGVADRLPLTVATRLRREALALGDSSRAPWSPLWPETLWSRVLALSSPWQWDALSHLATRRLARGDAAGADSLLSHAAIGFWPPEDRASRLALAARVRAAVRDTGAALAMCRQAMRAFPTLPGARVALGVCDTLMSARRDSAGPADLALAAEVLFWSGDRPGAIARLSRAFGDRRAEERWRLGLRLGEIERLARRLTDGSATLQRTLRLAPDSSARAKVWLERARIERDAGSLAAAYAAYRRAAALAPRTITAESAEWEVAREAEEQADAHRAEHAYRAVEALSMKHASEARLRRGLLLFNAGSSAGARAAFAAVPGEAGRFWWAVAAGESSAAARQAVFDSLAHTPGYSFYRAAARDSLSRLGWPAGLSLAMPAATPGPALALASALIDAGAGADAAALIDRWAADDPRALAPQDGVTRHPRELLLASALDARAQHPREGVRLAQRACEALADSSAPLPWSGWPSVYAAPSFPSLDRALAAEAGDVDPALMRALIWKESHFDSGAVSRTGATGLTQLMPETARRLAVQSHDPAPSDSMLMLPSLNVRYGAAYLASLVRHFDGRITLALAAYNAGTRAAERWSSLRRHGGEAMQCEMIAYSETQDYVKGILAARAAYRELTPLRSAAR